MSRILGKIGLLVVLYTAYFIISGMCLAVALIVTLGLMRWQLDPCIVNFLIHLSPNVCLASIEDCCLKYFIRAVGHSLPITALDFIDAFLLMTRQVVCDMKFKLAKVSEKMINIDAAWRHLEI